MTPTASCIPLASRPHSSSSGTANRRRCLLAFPRLPLPPTLARLSRVRSTGKAKRTEQALWICFKPRLSDGDRAPIITALKQHFQDERDSAALTPEEFDAIAAAGIAAMVRDRFDWRPASAVSRCLALAASPSPPRPHRLAASPSLRSPAHAALPSPPRRLALASLSCSWRPLSRLCAWQEAEVAATGGGDGGGGGGVGGGGGDGGGGKKQKRGAGSSAVDVPKLQQELAEARRELAARDQSSGRPPTNFEVASVEVRAHCRLLRAGVRRQTTVCQVPLPTDRRLCLAFSVSQPNKLSVMIASGGSSGLFAGEHDVTKTTLTMHMLRSQEAAGKGTIEMETSFHCDLSKETTPGGGPLLKQQRLTDAQTFTRSYNDVDGVHTLVFDLSRRKRRREAAEVSSGREHGTVEFGRDRETRVHPALRV